MTDFTYDVATYGCYDFRDDADDQRGAKGASIYRILRGPLATLACDVNTGWVSRPLVGPYARRGGPQERSDRPGVDNGVRDVYPTTMGVWIHATEPLLEHWTAPKGHCNILNIDRCYGDGSFSYGDEVLAALIEGGDDGWHAVLRDLYRHWVDDALAEDAALELMRADSQDFRDAAKAKP